MKPSVTLADYNILRSLIQNTPAVLKTKEIQQLALELNNATVIADADVSTKLVRVGSVVEIYDTTTKKNTRLKIVLPADADIHQKKISVLAPVSIALLGFKEGDCLDWEMPGGRRHIQILSVTNTDT